MCDNQSRFGSTRSSPRPKDLLHRLALGELVDQLVEDADLAHRRVLDRLDADAADHAFHRGARHPHYDIPSEVCARALELGARSITSRDAVRILRKQRIP